MKDNQIERMMDDYAFASMLMIIGIVVVITSMILSSGCLGINTGDLKTKALDAISPVVVLKGSAQYERMYPSVTTAVPTPIPFAVTTIPPAPTTAIKAKQIDMYANGERWQKQWFRHVTMRRIVQGNDLSPMKPLEFGVVVYDHKFLSSYTWWSDANGQYYREVPAPGYKYLIVFVHEEVFGDPKFNIPNMPILDAADFVVQNKQNFYYNDTTYNPVDRILEFDTKGDYYGISRVGAFGYTRIFVGQSTLYNTQFGGWIAEQKTDVYTGLGNAVDGYIVYQVPSYATDSDTFLVGNFGTQGNAYWRFDIYAGN